MRKRKKFLIMRIIMAMLLIFTACSNHKKEVIEHTSQEKTYVYQASFQKIGEALDNISKAYVFNEYNYIVGYKNEKNKHGAEITKYYLIKTKLGEKEQEEIKLNMKKGEEPCCLCVGEGNQLYLLSQCHMFDSDLAQTIEDYYIHIINIEKRTEDSCKLKLKKRKEEELWVHDMIVTEDTVLFNSEEEVYAFDLQGKQKGCYNFGNYTGAMVKTERGDIYVCGYSGGDYGLRQLDLEREEFGRFISLLPKNIYKTQGGNYNLTLCGGKEDILYINDSNSVHCYHTETEEMTTLFNWVNNNVDGSTITQMVSTEEQEFFAVSNSGQEGKHEVEIAELKRVDASLIKERTVLKLGCIYVTNAMKQNILSFNKTNSDYQIEIEDYSSYENPEVQLNLDMIAGKIPDILSIDSLPVRQYIKKGILTDLYPFMEKDQDVSKDDFIETVIHALEYNRKLYYMGSDFSVRPLLGSNKFTKGMEAWTVDDMLALYERLPKNGVFLCNNAYNISRQLFLQNILSNQLEDYVRIDIGEVFFDSEEFIKILKFSKNFPDEKDIAENVIERFKKGMPIMVQEGKLILSDCFNLYCMPDIQAFMKMYQKAGGFTVMNYPSIQGDNKLSMTIGNNTMAVTEKCADKEAAWEFVRMFLTYDYQKSKGFYEGIPTRKDAFETMLEYSMIKETFTDKDGMLVEPVDIRYFYDDYTVTVGPLKKEEIEMIRSIVGRIGKCTYNDSVTKEICNIVIEEAEAFFAGDKTAKEAALVMQNRAKIYISEHL